MAFGADPVYGVCSFWDVAGFGAPGDDELAGSSAAGDAVDDDGFAGFLVLIHEVEELVDLFVGGDSVVWDVDVVVVELVWDVFAVVELAAVDDGFDAVVSVEVEDVWVWPP